MGAESYAADSVELAILLELPQAQRDRVMSNASSRAIRFFILSTSFHFTVIYKFILNYKDADFRIKFYGPRYSTSTHLPLWVLYVSYPVGSIAMVLGYLRITPGKVKALWTNTVEKTEFEKINEGEIE